MKNSINLAKFHNGMLLNLSLIIGIAMLSSCAKDDSISPSASLTQANLREPEGEELLFSFSNDSRTDDVKIYTIEVNAEGTIQFEGIKGTRFIGKIDFKSDRDRMWDIAHEMENMGMYDLENEYLESDGTETYRVTVLNIDVKNRKKVVDHGVAPDVLTAIQSVILERIELKELIGE